MTKFAEDVAAKVAEKLAMIRLNNGGIVPDGSLVRALRAITSPIKNGVTDIVSDMATAYDNVIMTPELWPYIKGRLSGRARGVPRVNPNLPE